LILSNDGSHREVELICRSVSKAYYFTLGVAEA